LPRAYTSFYLFTVSCVVPGFLATYRFRAGLAAAALPFTLDLGFGLPVTTSVFSPAFSSSLTDAGLGAGRLAAYGARPGGRIAHSRGFLSVRTRITVLTTPPGPLVLLPAIIP